MKKCIADSRVNVDCGIQILFCFSGLSVQVTMPPPLNCCYDNRGAAPALRNESNGFRWVHVPSRTKRSGSAWCDEGGGEGLAPHIPPSKMLAASKQY
jgi:hypothetical protein